MGRTRQAEWGVFSQGFPGLEEHLVGEGDVDEDGVVVPSCALEAMGVEGVEDAQVPGLEGGCLAATGLVQDGPFFHPQDFGEIVVVPIEALALSVAVSGDVGHPSADLEGASLDSTDGGHGKRGGEISLNLSHFVMIHSFSVSSSWRRKSPGVQPSRF